MFFDRALFKANAKKTLQRFYGTAILVCLVASIIGNATVSVATSVQTAKQTAEQLVAMQNGTVAVYDEQTGMPIYGDTSSDSLEEALEEAKVEAQVLPISIISACFLAYPLLIGQNRYFLNARENPDKFGDVFFGFKKKYLKNVWTGFTYQLYTSLWSLLFIVPGIIKGYEYSMIPYILAENPEISRKDAYKMSKAMTKGYKGDLFVLNLSFIGWHLLVVLAALLTCGIGAISGIFLAPYIAATQAEAYTFLKARAIESGKIEAEALPGFVPAVPVAEVVAE